ncbi:MAG TPA: hypothetical protein VK918_03995, partial [Pyrinomonadaceae bacterium]|nr:hypothetical protein [Pyrinomonadaceae bacterium]
MAEFPTYGFGYYGLSKIHRLTNNTKAALEECSRAAEYLGGSIFARLAEAECLAADGRIADALEKLQSLEVLSKDRFVSPYQMSLAYCFLAGQAEMKKDSETAERFRDNAFELLDRSIEFKESWLNWLGMEPVFDVIRDDERYDELLEATGYRMLFKNFAASGMGLLGTKGTGGRVLDRTTLVIEHGPDTDGGTEPAVLRKHRSNWAYAAGALALLFIALTAGYIFSGYHT